MRPHECGWWLVQAELGRGAPTANRRRLTVPPAALTAFRLCLLAVSICGAAAAAEQPSDGGSPAAAGRSITLELRDADLADTVRMLAKEMGTNVIIDPQLSGRISISFRDIPAKEALDALLKTYGYVAVQDGNVVRVIRKPEDKPELQQSTFSLNGAVPEDLEQMVNALLSGDGTVAVNAASRTVIVVDHPERIETISALFDTINKRRKQVMIEARILEVGLDDRDQFGLTWSWIYTKLHVPPKTLGSMTQSLLPPDADDFVITIDSKHMDATLQALATHGYVNLLSSPKIVAVDGETAKMEVIEEIPYIEATVAIASDAGGASTTTSESVVFKDVGVTLTVTPQIGADSKIRMTVVPEVSEAPTRFNGVPVVTRRKVETQVIVADNEVLAIGGLIRENEIEDIRRVPYLSAIPWLGKFFQSRDTRTVKTEMLVLIQPTILDDTTGTAMTGKLKSSVAKKRSDLRPTPDELPAWLIEEPDEPEKKD